MKKRKKKSVEAKNSKSSRITGKMRKGIKIDSMDTPAKGNHEAKKKKIKEKEKSERGTRRSYAKEREERDVEVKKGKEKKCEGKTERERKEIYTEKNPAKMEATEREKNWKMERG